VIALATMLGLVVPLVAGGFAATRGARPENRHGR
jgi:hypothetical protein